MQRDQRHVMALLDRILEPSSNCVDVGAHDGSFLHEFVRRAPLGHHVAIEPLPELAERLRAAFPQVEVHEVALADRNGTATFFRAVGREAWSGLTEQDYPEGITTQPLTVAVARLDELLDDVDPVNFVKIDVEGAELMALRGAERTVLVHRPVILFEHAELHAMKYEVSSRDIHETLTALGYEIRSLDGKGPHNASAFASICAAAAETGYQADAETNFVASPTGAAA